MVLEKVFLMQTISKVFTEFVAMSHLCYVLGFGHQAGGTFAPPTPDQTCAPFLGRRSLHHWMAREHPSLKLGHNAD